MLLANLLAGLFYVGAFFWGGGGVQVDSELKDNVAKAYFSAVKADKMKASDL